MNLASLVTAAALVLPASLPHADHRPPAPVQHVSFFEWLGELFSGSPQKNPGVNPDAAGTLPQRYTDFGPGIWRNTSSELVTRLLDELPDRIDSAAQHRLARNLLIAIAVPPAGDRSHGELVERRIDRLMRLGNVDDAAGLARAVPGVPRDSRLARMEVETEILAGQEETACIDVRAFAQKFDEPWAKQGLALCKARDGETGTSGLPASPDMGEALAAAVGGQGSGGSDPARLAGAAHDPQLPLAARLDAALAAGRASAIDGDALAEIFRAARVSGAPAEGPPRGGMQAARLFHAIAQESEPGHKLALVERGLFSPDGVLDSVGVAMAAPLRKVEPRPEHAARFALLLYAAGYTQDAARWAKLAGPADANELWPYQVLLKQADPKGFAKWAKRSRLDPRQLQRIGAILSAFGGKPALGVQLGADDNDPKPAQSDLPAIDRAALNLRVGETALRALALLGNLGPTGVQPLVLRHVLAGLDRVALHDEARALAFEAMTATLLGVDHRSRAPSRVASQE
jgi:hypothetical protein